MAMLVELLLPLHLVDIQIAESWQLGSVSSLVSTFFS
jgi:hypothetical protein